MTEQGSESQAAAGMSSGAFVACGLAYLIAAAVVAVLHATDGITRGWWLVAFLSLVGGLSQLLLGPGLLALARRSGGPAPGRYAMGAALLLWNGGTAAVAIADLAPSMAGVLAGSALLLLALVLFARAFRTTHAAARRPAAPGWVRSYASLLGFLALSVVVGVLLAYVRGR